METLKLWTYLLVCIALSPCTLGIDCNVTEVNECFKKAVYYENTAFPLFGQDEEELDETCIEIYKIFLCMNNFTESCRDQQECDETCDKWIYHMELFSNVTGLLNFYEELCHVDSPMRKAYLDNYVCLEDNTEKYAACHNMSQQSQVYMMSLEGIEITAKCCYFSWYQDCFTNATETCNTDAKVYVSHGIYTLVTHVERKICQDYEVRCDKPPLGNKEVDEGEDEDGTSIGIEVSTKGIQKVLSKSVSVCLRCSANFILLMFIISTKYINMRNFFLG